MRNCVGTQKRVKTEMLAIREPGRDCCDWVGPSYLSQAAHTIEEQARRVSNFQQSETWSHDNWDFVQGLDLNTDP